MFDYKKFIDTYTSKPRLYGLKYVGTYAAKLEFLDTCNEKPDGLQYSARFYAPDYKDVWGIMWSGPITMDGVIELMKHDEQGDISIIDIRRW